MQGDWDGILEPGERILWQGRPDASVVWADLLAAQTLFGLFVTVFALFWIGAAAAMTGSIGWSDSWFDLIGMVFPLFGVPFVGVGLYMVVGRLFHDAFRRGRTWYTLSDQAAYVATDMLGKRALRRHDIDRMDRLELDDSRPGSVWFGQDRQLRHVHFRARDGFPGRTHSYVHLAPVGFERIADARAVYGMIRDLRPETD